MKSFCSLGFMKLPVFRSSSSEGSEVMQRWEMLVHLDMPTADNGNQDELKLKTATPHEVFRLVSCKT